MQWPERVCLIISSFRDPRDGMSVMDTRLSNFSRPPSLFSRGRVERLRIEIGEIGSWYLLPSIGSDVGHFIIFRIRKWEWKRRSDVMKILKKVDENNTKRCAREVKRKNFDNIFVLEILATKILKCQRLMGWRDFEKRIFGKCWWI